MLAPSATSCTTCGRTAMRACAAQATAAKWSGTPHQGRKVQGIIEPIIHKAAVKDLRHPLRNAGLSIGDTCELHLGDDDRIAVYVHILRRRFLIRRRVWAIIGYLGAQANPLLSPALRRGDPLRVRLVGLTPEHLSTGGTPEMYISVWGNTQHFHQVRTTPLQQAPA